MTSRERVFRALEFRTPDRAPRDLWPLPWISMYAEDDLKTLLAEYPTDFTGPPPVLAPGERAQGTPCRKGHYTDEWGSLWEVGEDGVIGEVKAPALADWSAFAGYRPPWETLELADWSVVSRSQEANLAGENPKFFTCGTSVRPFERMQFLRGSENLYLDLGYGTPEALRLRDMLHDFYCCELEHWAKTDADCIRMMDDWGSQRGLLISPDMWRELFAPLYRDYVRIIKSAGKKAFFHSDGNIQAIYPDLIEIGFDAINSQIFCMDMDELARIAKGRVTFWGELDRQNTLPFGTLEEIRAAVARVRRTLADPRGGVIAQCEWGTRVPIDKIRTVFAAWDAPLESLP